MGQAIGVARAPTCWRSRVRTRGLTGKPLLFSRVAREATDPPANFIHTLTNHNQGQIQMLGTLCLSTKEPITTEHHFSGSICYGFRVPSLPAPSGDQSTAHPSSSCFLPVCFVNRDSSPWESHAPRVGLTGVLSHVRLPSALRLTHFL